MGFFSQSENKLDKELDSIDESMMRCLKTKN